MTGDATTRPVQPRTRWRDRLVAAAVMVVVWMLLWGVFSWANLISGLAAAAVVLAVFPLPCVSDAHTHGQQQARSRRKIFELS